MYVMAKASRREAVGATQGRRQQTGLQKTCHERQGSRLPCFLGRGPGWLVLRRVPRRLSTTGADKRTGHELGRAHLVGHVLLHSRRPASSGRGHGVAERGRQTRPRSSCSRARGIPGPTQAGRIRRSSRRLRVDRSAAPVRERPIYGRDAGGELSPHLPKNIPIQDRCGGFLSHRTEARALDLQPSTHLARQLGTTRRVRMRDRSVGPPSTGGTTRR